MPKNLEKGYAFSLKCPKKLSYCLASKDDSYRVVLWKGEDEENEVKCFEQEVTMQKDSTIYVGYEGKEFKITIVPSLDP